MATTPMTFKVNIKCKDFTEHPIRIGFWTQYPSTTTFIKYLADKHNINLIQWLPYDDMIQLIFKSEHDYTLWQLHQ